MIRHISPDLLYVRRGLRVRYGYNRGLVTVWGGWRWTHRSARRELMRAMEAVGL